MYYSISLQRCVLTFKYYVTALLCNCFLLVRSVIVYIERSLYCIVSILFNNQCYLNSFTLCFVICCIWCDCSPELYHIFTLSQLTYHMWCLVSSCRPTTLWLTPIWQENKPRALSSSSPARQARGVCWWRARGQCSKRCKRWGAPTSTAIRTRTITLL